MKSDTRRVIRRMSLWVSFMVLTIATIFAQGFSPQTQIRLQKVLDDLQVNAANPVVGGISACINVDGLAVWQGASGYAARNVDADLNLLPGGTPFTTSTLSQMYSVTKTFTAALTIELSKDGYFSLDDPVVKFIPYLSVINPALNGNVIIRQLLAHESGYSDYTEEMMILIYVAAQPTKVWTPFEMLSLVHQINTPGAERRYSSTNYILLGQIIEMVTGKPMEQHYRERFFIPLGLNTMYLTVRENNTTGFPLAAPHDNFSYFNPVLQMTGQPLFPNFYTNVSRFPFTAINSLAFTGGGLVSNVGQLAQWGNALFGGRATRQSTIDLMMNSISSTPDETGDYLGYGIWTNHRISETDYFVGHNGRAPGYRAVMFYQTDRKMTIAVMTNYYGIDPYDIAKALYEALPNFIGGNENRKEAKIIVCHNGNVQMVAREAAPSLIRKGAYLGACDPLPPATITAMKSFKVTSDFRVFPNPFQNNCNINFTTTQTGPVTVKLLDMNGNVVASLFNATVEKGVPHQLPVVTTSLPAGTYTCVLQTPTGVEQQRIVLMK